MRVVGEIVNGIKTIKVFNQGKMKRDFTFIDDIVEAIYRCCMKPATIDAEFNHLSPNPSTSSAPHRIFNLGNSQPTKLLEFIETLEDSLGVKAKKEFMPMQPGDVEETAADISKLNKATGFIPSTSIEIGIPKFISWYRKFHN